ncbi:MAG: YkgJ family cysteine cluster protein [Proteobacteria bacterium]|nr:YkgJ family cysteine cluster protein [Pseudomonadota bacterium]
MGQPDSPRLTLVAGRSCDGCTMCCKLMKISVLEKPAFVWCKHCDIGKGCSIYADRPEVCRDFYCAYRHSADLGEEWRPSDCKMVVNYEDVRNRINVAVDPSRKGLWRQSPYIEQIKIWAMNALRQRGHLIVWEGADAIVVLPDREVNFGPLGNRTLVVMGRSTPLGEQYDALALEPGDPRLEQYKPTV